MKITVTFASDQFTAAAVHLVPGRLARLFGARERDAEVSSVPDIRGGRRWLWADTGIPVPSAVEEAIEDERQIQVAAQHVAEIERRSADRH